VYGFECMYRICVSVHICRGTDASVSLRYLSVHIRVYVFECMYVFV